MFWDLLRRKHTLATGVFLFVAAFGGAVLYYRVVKGFDDEKRKRGYHSKDKLSTLHEFANSSPTLESKDLAIQDIMNWRKEREKSCRNPFGWLSLTGLYWLHKGRNTIGTTSASEIVFEVPPNVDKKDYVPNIGVINFISEQLFTFQAAPGVPVKIGGNLIQNSEVPIVHDDDGKSNPDILSLGSLQWFIIKRSDQYGVRVKDCNNPVLLNFKGNDNYPINLALRIEGTFKPYTPPKMLQMATAIGTIEKHECPGYVTFMIDGSTHSLDVVGCKTELHVTFADTTSGKETYGGGRMLGIAWPTPGSDKVLIDFNKAYNPPCVFTPFATCPLPLLQNRLKVSIRAGEKDFKEDE